MRRPSGRAAHPSGALSALGWKVFNLVITRDNGATDPVTAKPVPKDVIREEFAHLHETPRQLIEHGQDWEGLGAVRRDPIDGWVDGRVALLGDAAHPTLQ